MKKPSSSEILTLPLWAQRMYVENPNAFEVDSLYKNYFRANPFVKSYHTQYYKRWRRNIENRLGENGYEINYSLAEVDKMNESYLNLQNTPKASSWSSVGPYHTQRPNGQMGETQTNVYSIDQCKGQPNVLYLGTEPGEIFKSIDGSDSWTCVSLTLDLGSGVSAIEVHPLNADIVFAGGNNGVYRSMDGGVSWSNVLPGSNLNVNEILINEGNDQIVLVASDNGLFRSIDGGTSWTTIYPQKTFDIKLNTANNNIVYMLKDNPALEICEFYSSSDMGLNWTIQSNGWYSSNDPARNDGGGRLAVSEADPNRVYAYLIGEAKADDYGFIGVYRSNDGGVNWTLPNGPAGGPYTSTHLNLAYGQPSWTYHQGFYNCAIVASEFNANDILVGGLNLYRSTDGGATFFPVAGYVGGTHDMHVDMQDFRMINGETWITTDGGVYHSTDFCGTQPQFKMDGVRGSDYWGLGSGWNEDVLVGGLYHNGNLAYHENYGNGNFLALGGGEAPTGYVNPGNNRKTYFSDIGGKIIPLAITDPILDFSIGKSPNESYWAAESSEMEFHPNCYSIAFLGNENKLWRTNDAGSSYSLVKIFGTSVNDIITYIEISTSNPNVMYVSQRPASGSLGKLWKSIDGGATWSSLTLPSGNSRRTLISINPLNENELWIAYPSGANGTKVYKTIDGGVSWINLTSSVLNNESIHSLVHIAGTDGGVYVATSRAVFYRNNTTSWVLDNSGLPTFTSGNILRPFYRENKIRLGSYGKGIWESPLNETPANPICRITVDKTSQEIYCWVDSFYFEDHSFLNHTGASWSWEFPTGSPSVSNQRNPAVLFSNDGSHLAVLTITDQNGNSDVDSIYVEVNSLAAPTFVNENFEGVFLPEGWFYSSETGGGNWTQSTSAGGYGTSLQSMMFGNYDYDAQGNSSDLSIPLNSIGMSEIQLTFDVAYAPYGGQYSDSLEVLVSTDCGLTFTSLYFKGGATLGTAPATSDYYTPTANEWRTESLDLSAFVNFNKVIVAFRNHGHWGNNIYVDNINIQNDLGKVELSKKDVEIYPNPIGSGCALNIVGIEQEYKAKIFDINGKCVYTNNKVENNRINIPDNLNVGMYRLNIQSENRIYNRSFIVK